LEVTNNCEVGDFAAGKKKEWVGQVCEREKRKRESG